MPTLHWLTREKDLAASARAPYRVLEAVKTYGDDPETENMLIQGDNLDALKALVPFYAGKIKCIYIDPPYNTESAFESYDDNLEHTVWLSILYPRLELLRCLLSDDGIFLTSINDDEGHYLKIICDEIFGRDNFKCSLVWNYEGNTDNQAAIINYHEYILVYTKNGKLNRPNIIDPNIAGKSKLYKGEIRNTVVKNGPKNPMSDIVIPKGFPANFEFGIIEKEKVKYPKYSEDIVVKKSQVVNQVIAHSGWSSKKILMSFIDNNFNSVKDSKGNDTFFELTENGAIEYYKPRDTESGHFVSVLRGFGTTNQMRLLLKKIGVKFSYPKPIGLIEYLLRAFTNDGDIILDSFCGSGTTGHATLMANKNSGANRKFIIIEREDDTVNKVVIPRLTAAINGHPKAELPPLGGGFKHFRLGDTVFDDLGKINPSIGFAALAAHIWFCEVKNPHVGEPDSPLLGVHEGVAYYLLFNGILGDKTINGGNVLTTPILKSLPSYDGPKVIYGEGCRFGPKRLKDEQITFKKIPNDINAR